MVIGADGANSRVAKDIDAGEYDYAIAFQVRRALERGVGCSSLSALSKDSSSMGVPARDLLDLPTASRHQPQAQLADPPRCHTCGPTPPCRSASASLMTR